MLLRKGIIKKNLKIGIANHYQSANLFLPSSLSDDYFNRNLSIPIKCLIINISNPSIVKNNLKKCIDKP